MKKVLIAASNVSEIDDGAKQQLLEAGFAVEEYPDAASLQSEAFVNLLQNVDAVIAGLEKYTRPIMEQVPSLKLIARRGVGVDNVDLDAAKELGITVTRTEGLVGSAVAELIMGYLLEHSRKLSIHNYDMKNGIWTRRISEGLKGKTLGLIGFGSIAQETSIRANAFGMKVLCFYRHRDTVTEKLYQVQYTDFDTLISTSDYISINVPLTTETKNMFHKEVFERMKCSSVIINTARSAIINVNDLKEALKSSSIAGAYIDVFDSEPYYDASLLTCENTFFTPHIGTFTKETFQAMNNRCAEQVITFFKKQ